MPGPLFVHECGQGRSQWQRLPRGGGERTVCSRSGSELIGKRGQRVISASTAAAALLAEFSLAVCSSSPLICIAQLTESDPPHSNGRRDAPQNTWPLIAVSRPPLLFPAPPFRFNKREEAQEAVSALNNIIPQGGSQPLTVRVAEDPTRAKTSMGYVPTYNSAAMHRGRFG